MVKVLVNGVGAIGKRVAHAVRQQKDMELVGICDAFPTGVLKTELSNKLREVNLYSSNLAQAQLFKKNGFQIKGTLKQFLTNKNNTDVVIDCTPPGIDEFNKKIYRKFGVKSIFQGGAKNSIVDKSFNTRSNYEQCLNLKSLRVVSCNTTGLLRGLVPIHENFLIKQSTIGLVRRAVDPWNSNKGPINSTVPVLRVPSHHGPDLQTVRPDIKIVTQAVKVPTTLMHTHMNNLEIEKQTTKEEVCKTFQKEQRIELINGNYYPSTSQIMEHAKNSGNGDFPKLGIWENTINVVDKNIYWIHAVHSESIVVPENIDAIRCITGIETDWKKTQKTTNKTLKI